MNSVVGHTAIESIKGYIEYTMSNNPNPQEDLGYAFVHAAVAKAGVIWRQTTAKDIGIDGIIEMERNDGASLYIAVQVKSGKSYFKNKSESHITLYNMKQINYWNRLQVPVIIVIYNPTTSESCWLNIQHYVLDHPGSLKTKKIRIPIKQNFNSSAFDIFRSDARVILTPKLSRSTVREFLEINRNITVTGFVELSKTALNNRSFGCRRGIKKIEYLRDNGLVECDSQSLWKATKKGVRYVQFMLGDRYFIPFMLIEPTDPITDDNVDMCMDFDKYILKLREEDEE